jgi:hypothetical protein
MYVCMFPKSFCPPPPPPYTPFSFTSVCHVWHGSYACFLPCAQSSCPYLCPPFLPAYLAGLLLLHDVALCLSSLPPLSFIPDLPACHFLLFLLPQCLLSAYDCHLFHYFLFSNLPIGSLFYPVCTFNVLFFHLPDFSPALCPLFLSVLSPSSNLHLFALFPLFWPACLLSVLVGPLCLPVICSCRSSLPACYLFL